jgi:hypothetical protein
MAIETTSLIFSHIARIVSHVPRPLRQTIAHGWPLFRIPSLFQVLRQYLLFQRLHQLVFDFQNWLGRQVSFDAQTTGSMYKTQVSVAVSEPLVLKRDVTFDEFAHAKTPRPPTAC